MVGAWRLRSLSLTTSLIVREGVAQILAGEPEMQIVASCGDLPSLLAAVEADPPDVVVTDIRMPPTSTDEGIRLARLLREEHPTSASSS
jgi:DNA-binding NarL/FixJ family response regulator